MFKELSEICQEQIKKDADLGTVCGKISVKGFKSQSDSINAGWE